MGYIGQEPSVGGYELLTISGTINGSNTSFTLSKAPATANHLMVIINGVLQIWGTGYTVSGTTLTTTSAPATGSTMAALMLGSVYDIGKPSDGSVVAASIANDQIDSQHYAAGSIDLEHMSSESVDEDNLHISNAGSNGQFLSKQSGNAGGLTWAAAGGGKVLQVVMDSSTTAESTTSTSFVASALSVSITPSSTASKILVLCSCDARTTAQSKATWYGISKGGTILGSSSGIVRMESSGGALLCGLSLSILDSPSTTSATTYALSHKAESGVTSWLMYGNEYGSIIAMEIGT